MALGGDGVISVFSNPYPSMMKKLTDAMLINDLSTAQKINNQYLSMMNALFVETSPSPVKYVMNRLKLCENVLRLPLMITSSRAEEILNNEMLKISKS